MPAQSKLDMLAKVSESLEASKGLFVIDYRGLTVKEAQELRHSLRENGAVMKVYKNNIVKIALEKAAKVVKEASKKFNKLEFRGGITDGVVVNAEQAIAIADLPSREELIAKFVGCISNPLSGIVRVCNGSAQGLVTALDALVDQKNAA